LKYFPLYIIYHFATLFPQVVKNCNAYLPTASRLCLISTFIEDGLRMYFQWSEQSKYMDMSWNCGMFLATVFVLINLVGQLGGCILILLQKHVRIACGVLFFIVVLQVSQHCLTYIFIIFLFRLDILIDST